MNLPPYILIMFLPSEVLTISEVLMVSEALIIEWPVVAPSSSPSACKLVSCHNKKAC
jgi:hypothetical protein